MKKILFLLIIILASVCVYAQNGYIGNIPLNAVSDATPLITPANISPTGASAGQVIGYNGTNITWVTPTGTFDPTQYIKFTKTDTFVNGIYLDSFFYLKVSANSYYFRTTNALGHGLDMIDMTTLFGVQTFGLYEHDKTPSTSNYTIADVADGAYMHFNSTGTINLEISTNAAINISSTAIQLFHPTTCNSSITSAGLNTTSGFSTNIKTISSSTYTGTIADGTVICNTASNAIAVTIPVTAGYIYRYKNSSSSNSVTITPASGQINGASNFVLSTLNSSVTVQCDGTNCWTF